jgi:hypothetical protein
VSVPVETLNLLFVAISSCTFDEGGLGQKRKLRQKTTARRT